jgi:hypothetical protein
MVRAVLSGSVLASARAQFRPGTCRSFLPNHLKIAVIDMFVVDIEAPSGHGPESPVPPRQIFPRVAIESGEGQGCPRCVRNSTQPARAFCRCHKAMQRGTVCLCPPPRSAQEQCAWVKGFHEVASNKIDKRRYFLRIVSLHHGRRVETGAQCEQLL